jgi:hypothetical protein
VQVLGICVFAYSYVCTVPSWLNEKNPGVNVNRAIWLPVAGAVAISMVRQAALIHGLQGVAFRGQKATWNIPISTLPVLAEEAAFAGSPRLWSEAFYGVPQSPDVTKIKLVYLVEQSGQVCGVHLDIPN